MSTHLDAIRASCARARAAKAAGITVDQLLANEAGVSLDEFVARRMAPRRRFFQPECQVCDGHGNYGRLGQMRCPECG